MHLTSQTVAAGEISAVADDGNSADSLYSNILQETLQQR